METLTQEYLRIKEKWRFIKSDDATQRGALTESFRILFAYHSGKIENQAITYHNTRDIFENGNVKSYTGDVCSLFEIQNLRACQAFLAQQANEARPIDEVLLLETHQLLTQGTYDEHRWQQGERPGAYKQGDYVVGVSDTGLPSCEVPFAVAELLEEIQVCNQDNALTVAAYFHASLEAIHPFTDGNGRVGRALLNYLLDTNGHPPIIVYNEDKMAYFAALQAWDSDNDLEPMKQFLIAETVKTWHDRI